MAAISLVAYDPDWPRRFDEERVLLERVLAAWLSGGVHHVGSTAVPGLAAKPIIDMIGGVAADPTLREEYRALKRRLARTHEAGDIAAYTADKRDFVARVLAPR